MRSSRDKLLTRRQRIRTRISKSSDRLRLSVFKSCRHIYAQLIDDTKGAILASASSLDKDIRKMSASNNNLEFAKKVGELIGSRASEKGHKKVVFDRGGRKYHGVLKACAEAARQKLDF